MLSNEIVWRCSFYLNLMGRRFCFQYNLIWSFLFDVIWGFLAFLNSCSVRISSSFWKVVPFYSLWIISNDNFIVFNHKLGGLNRRFFRGEGVKLPPCLKFVRNMLQTWNFVCKYTHMCNFRKYTSKYQKQLNFADISISFPKDQNFLAKIVPLLKTIVWDLS